MLEAIKAARRHGFHEREIAAASVFTTQSITSVMEKIRDQIKESTPEPATFLLGPAGERAVFNREDVASITWRQHTGLSPQTFTTAGIDLAILQVAPGAVGTIAYGYDVSPDYNIHPGEYMPPVGTLYRHAAGAGQQQNFLHPVPSVGPGAGLRLAGVDRCPRRIVEPASDGRIRGFQARFAWHCHAQHQQRG